MKLISTLSTLLLTYTITFSTSEVAIGQKDSVTVSILNDYVNIPAHDSIACVDTIFILVENNTTHNYIFAFEDSEIMFYDHQISNDFDFISDPFEGMAIKFLDKESSGIRTDASSGYDPEAFDNVSDFTPKANIKTIKPNESLTLKAVLEFPNSNIHGTLRQEVNNLKQATKIELIFAPPKRKSKGYLMNNQIVLGNMDRLLDTNEKFIIDVRISCR